jgi:hypothetical protein
MILFIALCSDSAARIAGTFERTLAMRRETSALTGGASFFLGTDLRTFTNGI